MNDISYEETFNRTANALYNNSYLTAGNDDSAMRGAINAVVEYALDHGYPEGVIEKMVLDALR